MVELASQKYFYIFQLSLIVIKFVHPQKEGVLPHPIPYIDLFWK